MGTESIGRTTGDISPHDLTECYPRVKDSESLEVKASSTLVSSVICCEFISLFKMFFFSWKYLFLLFLNLVLHNREIYPSKYICLALLEINEGRHVQSHSVLSALLTLFPRSEHATSSWQHWGFLIWPATVTSAVPSRPVILSRRKLSSPHP